MFERADVSEHAGLGAAAQTDPAHACRASDEARGLKQHDEAVFRVGWLPQSTSHFASGGDDGFLYLWDLSRVGMHQDADAAGSGGPPEMICTHADADAAGNGPPEIIMKHAGHRGSVQDFQ
ncbi:hypothetical protein T484DRAFT_1794956, partial [Baffinella frigidus]